MGPPADRDTRARPPSASPSSSEGSEAAASSHRRRPNRARRGVDARTSPAPEKPAASKFSKVWKVSAAVVVAAVAAAAVAWALKGTQSSTAPNAAIARVLVAPAEPLPSDVEGLFAVSPDGRQLVYVAGPDRERRLYLRNIDQFDSKPVPGSEGADFRSFPRTDSGWLS